VLPDEFLKAGRSVYVIEGEAAAAGAAAGAAAAGGG
jgi:pyruvate/2-oxoacid:ferredoxin oxidoreductase alpha subunit